MKMGKETRSMNNGTGLSGFVRVNTVKNNSVSKGPAASGGMRTPMFTGSGGHVGFKGSPNMSTPSVRFGVPQRSDMPRSG
jgi:hypothetical protein